MKKLFKKLKELTGFSYQDIADKVGVSKQHIYKILENHSLVYKTSAATILNLCIDNKIIDLERQVENLKLLKDEILQEAFKSSSETEMEDSYEGN